MKNKMIRYALLLITGSLLLTACQDVPPKGDEDTDKTTFLKKTEIGYYNKTAAPVVFTQRYHQLIISEDYSEYSIINTLDLLDYERITFQLNTPLTDEKVGMTVNITISSPSATLPNIDFIIEKIDGKKIWFWNNEKLIGIILEKL